MGTAVTIHGGTGADTINFAFTVTGTNTTRYTQSFASQVNNALLTEGVTFVSPLPTGAVHAPDGLAPVYDLVASTVSGATNLFSISNAGYVMDTISGASTLSIFGNDSVLVAGINSEAVINESGSGNRIIFVDGNNTFNGDSVGGANDTIVAGSGFDTIRTGGGKATVNSGTGNATIYLNDTAVGSAVNDTVWLDDGKSVIYANGANDAVIATVGGQTIDASNNTVAGSNLTVVLQATSSDNLVIGGSGNANVFGDASGDTVDGGSGCLYFIAGAGITANLNGGGGNIVAFGAAGDSIAFGNTAGTTTGQTELIAGAGNETLDGGAAASGILFFGGADTAGSDVLTGGAGNDTLTAGLGNETLTGGAGANMFLFNDQANGGGNITISDFLGSSGNELAFAGYDSTLLTALQNGVESNGNYVVTLSDSTTITFDNVTGYSQLNGHIITF